MENYIVKVYKYLLNMFIVDVEVSLDSKFVFITDVGTFIYQKLKLII